jgi:hypothetical protein
LLAAKGFGIEPRLRRQAQSHRKGHHGPDALFLNENPWAGLAAYNGTVSQFQGCLFGQNRRFAVARQQRQIGLPEMVAIAAAGYGDK